MKIGNLIGREDQLEAETFELEEIQETISQQTTWITQVVEQYRRKTRTTNATNTGTILQEEDGETVKPPPLPQLTCTSL